MGGAAGVVLVLGLVRTKFAAVLIGTAGVGALASYSAVLSLVGVVAGLGIQTSAVRQIAAAVAEGDDEKIARTITSLRRVCWLTGGVGAIALAAGSVPISRWTFGGPDHALQIASLGFAILFANLYAGQIALVQGMRRIGALAGVQIAGAAIGAMASILLYALLGVDGVVPALLIVAGAQLSASWLVARRISIPAVGATWPESIRNAGDMVKIGAAVMWSAVLASLVAYITNALIANRFGVEAVGVFSAALTLSGVFVNFVLNAMAADYYPRLTALAGQREAMQVLINQQTEVGLLLATPGLLAMISLAPWIVNLFYSASFSHAADLLPWFVMGCFGRVLAWPMSYVMLATSANRLYFVTETLFSALHLLLVVAALPSIGLEGAAVAFFLVYAAYTAAMWVVANRMVGFRWSRSTVVLLSRLAPVIALAFLSVRLLPGPAGAIGGLAMTAAASVVCMRGLVGRVGADHPIARVVKKATGFRLLLRGVD
jgi:enterobacterial common antigen flippase